MASLQAALPESTVRLIAGNILDALPGLEVVRPSMERILETVQAAPVLGTIKQRVVYGKYRDPMPGVFYRGVAPLTFVTPDGKEIKNDKLTIVMPDGKEQKSNGKLIVQGSETPFRFIVAEEPAQVYFNKNGEILAEDTLINRSW